jgi:hypothetical protein
MVLENQLFAPTLKGAIDFDYVELAPHSGARFFAPFRVRDRRRKSIKECRLFQTIIY